MGKAFQGVNVFHSSAVIEVNRALDGKCAAAILAQINDLLLHQVEKITIDLSGVQRASFADLAALIRSAFRKGAGARLIVRINDREFTFDRETPHPSGESYATV